MSITYKYIYDGSLEGFLTALAGAFNKNEQEVKEIQVVPSQTHFNEALFSEVIFVQTAAEAAKQFKRKVKNEISPGAYKTLYLAFLSEVQGIETELYHYLRLGFQIGKAVNSLVSDPRVRTVVEKSRKVGREKHKMLGFLRFRKLSTGIYYAPMKPNYNVITLLTSHFTHRLPDQKWMIHDTHREVVAFYNGRQVLIKSISGLEASLHEHPNEKAFQQMWRTFFRNVTIKNRENTRQQQQNMPQKYWEYMPEIDKMI